MASSEWDWFDEALAYWFAGRQTQADENDSWIDALPSRGWSTPFDQPGNLRESVRFLQFLEGRLGARNTFALWRSSEATPQRAIAVAELIAPYFYWLAETGWESLVMFAATPPPRSTLDHCSCHHWDVPRQALWVRFQTAVPDRLRASLLSHEPGGMIIDHPLPSGVSVAVPRGEPVEERLLLIRNIGHRHRKKPGAHDDGLEYQLEIGGKYSGETSSNS